MTRRKFSNLKKPSIGMLVALFLAAGGVAFGLLQSQSTMTGNSITSEGAYMVISQNDSNYGPSTAGYAFKGIIPGVQASQTEHFFLKNAGTSPLALKIGLTSTPVNNSNADLTKIHVILTPYSTDTFMPGTPQDFTLKALSDAGTTGLGVNYPTAIAASNKEEFNIQVAMDDGAASSSGATLSNVNFGFIGTAITN